MLSTISRLKRDHTAECIFWLQKPKCVIVPAIVGLSKMIRSALQLWWNALKSEEFKVIWESFWKKYGHFEHSGSNCVPWDFVANRISSQAFWCLSRIGELKLPSSHLSSFFSIFSSNIFTFLEQLFTWHQIWNFAKRSLLCHCHFTSASASSLAVISVFSWTRVSSHLKNSVKNTSK